MARLLRLIIVVLVAGFLGGFAIFAEATNRAAPPSPMPTADGVVALTGGGGARIAAAMTLLEQGAGSRLLISGVNPATSDEAVRDLTGGEAATFDCCVDLGRAARTTIGNGEETAAWARDHGFTSLIVVTSDYHMPRALLELEAAFGDEAVVLTAWPVRHDTPWWRDAGGARRVAVEYGKYLVTLARETARG